MLNKHWIISAAILLLGAPKAQAMCEAYIHRYEQQHGIPHNLLRAISRIESGRKISGQGIVAWPWTINANGKPYVFNTKIEAITKVKELRAQGITSIDVGCMQINLKHHPNAFPSLEAAFDPATNIQYAARFLKEKMDAQGNWQGAVAHYHSASAVYNQPYKNKVMAMWQQFANEPFPAAQAPIQTVFAINQPKVVNTQFKSLTGRIMPVKIKFSAYTGYNGTLHKVATNNIRTSGAIANTNFLRPTGGSKIIKAKTSLSSKRAVMPLNTVRRANVKLPPKV
ncbi:lytic transglycosylase domain-containing protein [Candidatus Odyssella acanthamoebae]|uniref:lytic transglycosylase domain-containing protein n=1 Tax=Candidatus Odyssella acanthamoebae TaxID=91604 RepID=UPI000690CABF|nr:lytic transglycosylase domain-containing protein [Candidatus Paracaedibacter acanthamoebae]